MFHKNRVLKHICRGGIAAGVMLAVTGVLILLSRHAEGFSLKVYLPFSRFISGLIGTLFSFTVLSAAEFILYMLGIAVTAYFVAAVVIAFRGANGWPLLRWVFDLVLTAVTALFLFFALWGCNYYSPKLETRMSLQTEPRSEEVLLETARWHLEQIVRYAGQVPRDESGAVAAGGFDAMAPQAANAMKALAVRYPELFSGALIPPPKRILSYRTMSSLGISGIYIPFTGESNVNPVNTEPFLPSTMCHELAHRLSFAPEEDANLVAYLACMESDQAVFNYSGALLAFTYCYNALSDSAYRASLWNELPPETVTDFSRNSEAWKVYEGPLRKTASAVNDSYLKAMSQPEGIRSYGRVVDMLICLFLREQE